MHELPIMIYMSSQQRVGVVRNLLINNEDIIFHQTSNIYRDLLDYHSRYEPSIDSKILSTGDKNKTSMLLNVDGYLGESITEARAELYRKVLNGEETNYTHKTRHDYFKLVSSICVVTGTKDEKTGQWFYSGSCPEFWKETYCAHCATIKYQIWLKSLWVAVPRYRNKNSMKIKNRYTDQELLRNRYIEITEQLTNIKCEFEKRGMTIYE